MWQLDSKTVRCLLAESLQITSKTANFINNFIQIILKVCEETDLTNFIAIIKLLYTFNACYGK